MNSKSVLAVIIIMITLAILTIQHIDAARGNYQGGSKSVVVGENEYIAWFSTNQVIGKFYLEHL
jgi:hypothetical protein